MKISTTTTFASKLIPGLVYTIRKRSQARRLQFNAENATVIAAIKDASWRIQPIQQEAADAEEVAKLEPCSCVGHEHKPIELPPDSEISPEAVAHLCDYPGCQCHRAKYREGLIRELSDARQSYSDLRRDKYYPVLIRWAVKAVDAGGNTIENEDGTEAPITLDSIFSLPDEAVNEIGDEIDRLGSLSFEEQVGFPLPGTSSDQVAGPKLSAQAAS